MKLVTNDCEWLAIRDLRRSGALDAPTGGPAVEVPTRGPFEPRRASIHRTSEGVCIVIDGYRHKIEIAFTPCAYGGHRPWFVCPDCKRHCASLLTGTFECRACSSIGYASQQRNERNAARREMSHRMLHGDLFNAPAGATEDEYYWLMVERLGLTAAKLRERHRLRRPQMLFRST